MEVIFYSTHCPKCKVVEMKLKQKKINYKEIDNVDLMISKGLQNAPNLEVDGKIMNFHEAIQWLNEVK